MSSKSQKQYLAPRAKIFQKRPKNAIICIKPSPVTLNTPSPRRVSNAARGAGACMLQQAKRHPADHRVRKRIRSHATHHCHLALGGYINACATTYYSRPRRGCSAAGAAPLRGPKSAYPKSHHIYSHHILIYSRGDETLVLLLWHPRGRTISLALALHYWIDARRVSTSRLWAGLCVTPSDTANHMHVAAENFG